MIVNRNFWIPRSTTTTTHTTTPTVIGQVGVAENDDDECKGIRRLQTTTKVTPFLSMSTCARLNYVSRLMGHLVSQTDDSRRVNPEVHTSFTPRDRVLFLLL